ncbi:MAG: hypothetical protein PHX72_00280 [Candidatus Shapirobacteria bacterium]|nr:hypothetical protein [Candidatus Shapirobacteria bacterium]
MSNIQQNTDQKIKSVKRINRLVLLFFFLVLILVGLLFYWSLCYKDNSQLIGGERDEGGCLIGAGYQWCEPKQKCLRPWEEDCLEDYSDIQQVQ